MIAFAYMLSERITVLFLFPNLTNALQVRVSVLFLPSDAIYPKIKCVECVVQQNTSFLVLALCPVRTCHPARARCPHGVEKDKQGCPTCSCRSKFIKTNIKHYYTSPSVCITDRFRMDLYSFIHSFIHSFMHACMHSFIHSFYLFIYFRRVS